MFLLALAHPAAVRDWDDMPEVERRKYHRNLQKRDCKRFSPRMESKLDYDEVLAEHGVQSMTSARG